MLGHILTILSFSGALLALVAYTLFTQTKDLGWRTLARAAFRVHSIAILGIVVTLFTMLFNHWFAYDYVWRHSNTEMPLRYIASCFWEGQEGSFLLWTFWTMVLGNLLIWKAKTWEGPVLAVFALVQVFLATMLLGIYVFDVRVGSSPFLLIRELPENIGLPFNSHDDDFVYVEADAERFAWHFGRRIGAAAGAGPADGAPAAIGEEARDRIEPAPVIEVSGRLYPVEIRYQGFDDTHRDDDDESDLPSRCVSSKPR